MSVLARKGAAFLDLLLLVGIVWQVIAAEKQERLQAAFLREFELSREHPHQSAPASSAHE